MNPLIKPDLHLRTDESMSNDAGFSFFRPFNSVFDCFLRYQGIKSIRLCHFDMNRTVICFSLPSAWPIAV